MLNIVVRVVYHELGARRIDDKFKDLVWVPFFGPPFLDVENVFSALTESWAEECEVFWGFPFFLA